MPHTHTLLTPSATPLEPHRISAVLPTTAWGRADPRSGRVRPGQVKPGRGASRAREPRWVGGGGGGGGLTDGEEQVGGACINQGHISSWGSPHPGSSRGVCATDCAARPSSPGPVPVPVQSSPAYVPRSEARESSTPFPQSSRPTGFSCARLLAHSLSVTRFTHYYFTATLPEPCAHPFPPFCARPPSIGDQRFFPLPVAAPKPGHY